jgi:5-methylcytosine-specific restriction endonuclease McrA
MGQWVHRLSSVDESSLTATCANCGVVELKKTKNRLVCKVGLRQKKRKQNVQKKFPWRQHKKEACEACGFVPVHSIQLDVDHIDGNKKNNDLDNLQTLCANCHRLKTHINKDYIKTKKDPSN